MKKTILTIAAVSVLASCNKNNHKDHHDLIDKADWILGEWEHRSAEGKLTEKWTKENDSTFHGLAFFIKGTDTLHHETVVLTERGGQLRYSPTIKGQNNDKAVDFNLTSSENKKLVFENPAHDYPQKIVYEKKGNDSLVAEISGLLQGKSSTERFTMGKID